MKIKIAKFTDHSLLVTDEDLLAIYRFVASKYDKVEVIANCIDGTSIETIDLQDVLSFDNPDFRRIREISIIGHTGATERCNCGIDSDRGSSGSIILHSESDEQATYVTKELQSRIREMKPWYDLIAQNYIWTVLAIAPFFLFTVPYTFRLMIGEIQPTTSRFSTIDQINFVLVFSSVIFAICWPLNKLKGFLFPKVFFQLGKQKRRYEVISKWRTFIFVGVVFAIILGVAINGISKMVFK